MKTSILGLTLKELETVLCAAGFKRFNGTQIYDWIYKKNIMNPVHWSNVSKKAIEFLVENYSFDLPQIVWSGLSKDGTQKFLISFEDKNTVEAVVIAAKERRTLCVSSQVGCAIGCTFCHTGTQGLTRHLKSGEIVGQYLAISLYLQEHGARGISNIVYMGQGEPLHNFNNTKTSIEIFIEPLGIGLGQRKITLSTSGLVPQIKQLKEFPPVNIAISLHAAHNNLRSELMPINQRYDLERLFEAIRTIPLKAQRRITYEYLLIDGFNNLDRDVEALDKLLIKKESKINIIPFNEYPGTKFKAPSEESVIEFNQKLKKKGFISTIRYSKGRDILAACGQLKSNLKSAQISTS